MALNGKPSGDRPQGGVAVSIKNFTRRTPVPRLPFARAAEALLPGWEISLVFVGEARALALNKSLRNKTYVPNVLSYTVGPRSGEIIICPAVAGSQAPEHGLTPRAFILLLFIHGCLHLKGAAHSGTMERRERALLSRFIRVSAPRSARTPSLPTHGQAHRNRHRHRDVPGQTGRRRRAR